MANKEDAFLISRTGTYGSVSGAKWCHVRDGRLLSDLSIKAGTSLGEVISSIHLAVDDEIPSLVPIKDGEDGIEFLYIRPARESGWAILWKGSLSAAHAPLNTDLLRKLWDLTPTEASIANELLLTDSVQSIAELRGNSVETIRMHISNILSKTGAASQKVLVGLLARLSMLDL